MSNAQKTPFARSINLFAQQKAIDEIVKRATALPGHVIAVNGPIVTVNFDVADVTLPQVDMPIFGPEYIRYPIQKNDKGVAFLVPIYIGGVTGLGSGVADFTLHGNLSSLVWLPIGNVNWPSTPGINSNSVTIYGPDGVTLRDSTGETTLTLTPGGVVLNAQNSITLQVGSMSIVISAAGVSIEGREFITHDHQPGTYQAGSTPVTGTSGRVV